MTAATGPVEVVLLVGNVQTASSGPLDAVAGEPLSFGFDPHLDDETHGTGVGVLRAITLHQDQPFAEDTVTLRLKPGVGCG